MGQHDQGLSRLKPGVKRRVHLFAAPLLWTGVGSFLLFRGWEWIGPGRARWLFLLAIAIGTAKSLFILDRTARRVVARIVNLRDDTCLGAVYSWKTWLLVFLMMGSGMALRRYFSPGAVIGTLYAAVGWALLLSSRQGWREWYRWKNKED
ncbi:MAG: hypothetical protein ACYCYR_11395 [Desulfobulbaceae bacterium]